MSRKSSTIFVNNLFLLSHEYVNKRRMTDITQCKKTGRENQKYELTHKKKVNRKLGTGSKHVHCKQIWIIFIFRFYDFFLMIRTILLIKFWLFINPIFKSPSSLLYPLLYGISVEKFVASCDGHVANPEFSRCAQYSTRSQENTKKAYRPGYKPLPGICFYWASF
jgi:hypothetical protein